MAYGLQTYQDAAKREDLIDILTDVSPDSTPLVTLLGTTKAAHTLHQWTEEYISRPTSVTASAEGAAASYSDLSQPARRTNYTGIIDQTFRVSGSESEMVVPGMGDPYDYQAAKALREWKNKLEYNLVRSHASSGVSGYPRAMAGLEAVITSHATARDSGTSLSETEFNDMVEDSWDDVGADDVFDLVLVPFGLKQKISTFTAGSTRYIDASKRRLVRPVMVYESDGGVHRIMAHKDLLHSAGTVHFIGIKEDKYKIAYLRKPKREELAKDGDRRNGHIVGEATLEYLAERTSVLRSGYHENG